MKPVNLYTLTRLPGHATIDTINTFYSHLCQTEIKDYIFV